MPLRIRSKLCTSLLDPQSEAETHYILHVSTSHAAGLHSRHRVGARQLPFWEIAALQGLRNAFQGFSRRFRGTPEVLQSYGWSPTSAISYLCKFRKIPQQFRNIPQYSANFRKQSVKFRKQSATFHKQSIKILKQSAKFRKNPQTIRKIPQQIREIPQNSATTSLKACFSTKFE